MVAGTTVSLDIQALPSRGKGMAPES